MKNIKTKETAKNIKLLDKSASLTARMKNSFIRARNATANTISDDNTSPNDYAEKQIQTMSTDVIYDSANAVTAAVNASIKLVKRVSNPNLHADSGDAYSKHMVQFTDNTDTTYSSTHSPTDTNRAFTQGRELAKKSSVQRNITSNRTSDNSIYSRSKKSAPPASDSLRNLAASSRDKHIHTNAKQPKDSFSLKPKRTIKTPQNTSRTAIKTAHSATAVPTTAKHMTLHKTTVLSSAKKTSSITKAISGLIARSARAVIAGTKTLVSAVTAGGWVAVLIVIIICMVALIAGSSFGIFFSGEKSTNGILMCEVVREINEDFDTEMDKIKSDNEYDILKLSGARTPWKDVLAIYAVKTASDKLAPQEVSTVTEEKKTLIEELFWQMNTIQHCTETNIEVETVYFEDANGNMVEATIESEITTLYITIEGKTASQMADGLSFTFEQKAQLNELLHEDYNSLWTSVIYGVHSGDNEIVAVALSQLGNIGGEPYWSWYGFTSRVEWCACFVSWCANECGYIENYFMPKFAWCPSGVEWFKERDRWMDNSATPLPGAIIFFDWDDKYTNGPDGVSDHVGIVERVEDGYVYTIEGNSGDGCRQRRYAVGHYEILGYGIPIL